MKEKVIFVLMTIILTSMISFSQDNLSGEKGSFIDQRDNQSYTWIRLGNQVWMGKNLNYHPPKGNDCYNMDTTNCLKYGSLYNWKTAQVVCPPGWHLPSEKEWVKLDDFLDDQSGEKLKELGKEHWNGDDAVVRGDSKFNALPAGCKNFDSNGNPHFGGQKDFAYFWTSTTATPRTKAFYRFITSYDDVLHRQEQWKEWGYSVRCIADD